MINQKKESLKDKLDKIDEDFNDEKKKKVLSEEER